MAETLKVLGQALLVVTTLTDVYTVPNTLSTSISSITVCNQDTVDATFRIAIAVAGAANATKQYLYFDAPIPAKSTAALVLGITLSATDVVRAYTSGGSVSVNVFGVEIS
jgi:hypothetical protein